MVVTTLDNVIIAEPSPDAQFSSKLLPIHVKRKSYEGSADEHDGVHTKLPPVSQIYPGVVQKSLGGV